MKNLSLVIKSSAEEIYSYINVLQPLLDDFNTELIIINNEVERLDIPYKYIIYKFEEDYEKFIDFCKSISTKDNNIIIEQGMIISRELANKLKSKISQNVGNIFCNIKRFISTNEEKFIVHTYKLNVDSINSAEEYIDDILEDKSFLESSYNSIDRAITILFNEEKLTEVFNYYYGFIKKNNSIIEQHFYELLEKKKLTIDIDKVKLVEEAFLNSNDTNKYSRFLYIKNKYENGDFLNKMDFINGIKNLTLTDEDKYFCYLLLKVFKNKDFSSDLFSIFDHKVVKKYFQYLYRTEQDFYLYVYEYLISIKLNEEILINNNKSIDTYIDLCKWYIESMSEKSEKLESKQKLIQVFVDYTNYGFYKIGELKKHGRKVILNSEVKFLMEIDKAINLINENRTDSAVSVLKKAALIYPSMRRPVEYYAQRLRMESKKYPYKISICMIVKDEEKNIERCLSSLKPLVDSGIAEFVLVDTGSSDRTVELAGKYVKEVYFHQWKGSFSEARNYSISLAQGEYIFTMDADEEIEYDQIAKIINLFRSEEYKDYNTFSLKVKNFSDEQYKKFSIFTRNLIFINDGDFYFAGSVHNQPMYKLPIKHLDCTILHYGYIMTPDIKDKKFNRTATLLKKELEKNPKSIYYRFQLSVSYSMHGDIQESLEQTKIYMKLLKDNNEKIEDNLMYYNNAALVYTSNQLYDEAIEVCNEALEVQPDFIDFIFYKADGLFEKKEYRGAIRYFKEYLNLIDEFHLHDVMHDDRYLFYSLDSKELVKGLLAVSYNKIGEHKECIKSAEEISDNKVFKNVLYAVIDSYIKQEDKEAIVLFYEGRIYNNPENEVKELFKYYFEEYLLKVPEKEQKEYFIALAKSSLEDNYIDVLRFRAGNSVIQNEHRVLKFIDNIDIDEMDSISGNMIIDAIIPIVKTYIIDASKEIDEIKNLKRSAEFILHRNLNLKQYSSLNKEELLLILDKYISSCIYLISIGRQDLLEYKEINFTISVFKAFEELNKNNLLTAIGFIRDSVLEHKKMAKPMEIFLETIIPQNL